MTQDLPIPQPDSGDANERADQIMSRAEFNQSESILDRIGGWLNDLFNELLSGLSQGGVGSAVAWLLLAALVVGSAFLLARMRPFGGLAAKARIADLIVATEGPAAAGFRNASEWRREAEELLSEGRFDEALRARYRAILADLVTDGLIEDIAGRTPGEYRAELAVVAPAAAESFAGLTTQFENVWYGPVAAAAADVAEFEQAERAVLAGVAS